MSVQHKRIRKEHKGDYIDAFLSVTKEKMQLYKVAKYDIDRILGQDIEKEKARLQRRERSQTR